MLVREFQINQQTGLLAPSVTYMVGPMGPCCRINEQNQSEGYYPAGVTSTTPLTRGVTRWYVYDGLGSVIGELDANNNLTTSRQYDVYGAPRLGTQQGVAATSSQGYVGSLGHVTDQGTGGLIYMRARYYDPALGRFVSEDPGRNGGNWYTYCSNDPVNLTDATGKDAIGIGEILIGGILELLAECAFKADAIPLAYALVIIGAVLLVAGLVIEANELIHKIHDLEPLIQRQYDSAGIDASSTGILGNAGLPIALHMVEIDILCNSIDD